MKNSFFLSSLIVLLMTSCSMDSNYSLSSLDATIGLNADSLDIPQISTEKIFLKDILELKSNDGTITYDADSNYVFERVGQNITTTNCKVKQFTLTKRISKGYSLDIMVPSTSANSPMKKENSSKGIFAEGKIQVFTYSTTLPADVDTLEKVEIEGNLKLNVFLPTDFSKVVSTIDYLKISLPNFMNYRNVSITSGEAKIEDGVVTIKNIPADKIISLSLDVTSIDCTGNGCKNGSVVWDGKKITVTSDVLAEILASNPNMDKINLVTGKQIKSELVLSDVVVKSAVGRFSPNLNAVNIGKLNNTGLPSFLTNNNVIADLDNIFIYLTIDSDLPIDGYVGGTIKALKNNKTVATVEVPEFKVKAKGTTQICLCRKATIEQKLKYQCVEVPDISEIMKPVPDVIDFIGKGRADNTVTTHLELGKDYSISSSYKISANVAFGEDAVLVSEKTFDGWSAGLDRLELGKDSRITITAKAISTIPLYISAKANLTDKSGKVLSGVNIKSDEALIPASVDGKTPSSGELKIVVDDEVADVLKKVNGIKISISGSAKAEDFTPVAGVVLNGAHQYFEFKDVKINLKGKIFYNAN